jgi:hypothetical protein
MSSSGTMGKSSEARNAVESLHQQAGLLYEDEIRSVEGPDA